MREVKTQGFVLKKIPYQNEKTRLYSVMTKDFGKIVLSVPDSKKLSGSMKVMSPLNICEFEIYKSGNGHFKVRKINLMHSLMDHCGDKLETVQKLYVLAELIHLALQEGERNDHLFELLVNTAIVIKKTDSDLIFESFKTKLLQINGHLPNLKHCFNCKEKCRNDEIRISEETFNLYCENCMSGRGTENLKQLSLNSLKLLHYISSANFEKILKIRADEKSLHALAGLNDLLLKQILNSELKSLQKPLVS